MCEIKLYHGDCLELMKQIQDGSVDIVLTDPPFNISQDSMSIDRSQFKNKKMRRNSGVTLDFGDWDKKERKDFIEFTRLWFNECSRVLKDGGAFISFFRILFLLLRQIFGS